MDQSNAGLTFGDFQKFGELVNQILQSLINAVSRCVGLVNINRVSFHEVEGQEFVHKRRLAAGWTLIIPGNLVFWFRCVPVRVLHMRQWMRWESDVKLITRNEQIKLGRNLVFKKIPGETLSVAAQSEMQYSEKKELLFIAAKSLRKFHETEIDVAGAGRCLLSHGDASITNVLYDSNTKQAVWFDFDLRHDLRCEAGQRHADDLRSLLFSAVHLFNADSIEDWVRSQRSAYPTDAVWIALTKQVSSRWFAKDVFHHSQMVRARKKSGLSARELRQLDQKLAAAISDFAWHRKQPNE